MASFDPPQLKNRLFETTIGLWRLCDRFPQDDQPLVKRLRERATDVMDDTVMYFSVRGRSIGLAHDILRNLASKVEVLRSLLDLARMRHHVQEMNFLLLDWEYEQLLQLLQGDLQSIESRGMVVVDSASAEARPPTVLGGLRDPQNTAPAPQQQNAVSPETLEAIPERQKHLYEFFLRNKRATVQDLASNFPGVTDRTLRTDLINLVDMKLLRRVGAHPRYIYLLGRQSVAESPLPAIVTPGSPRA